MRDSDVVLVCISPRSLNKDGFVQREIRFALDVAEEKQEDSIFLIPVRLEVCDVPTRLRRFQWVDIFEDHGFERLLRSLSKRASALGLAIAIEPSQMAANEALRIHLNDERHAGLEYASAAPAPTEEEVLGESDLPIHVSVAKKQLDPIPSDQSPGAQVSDRPPAPEAGLRDAPALWNQLRVRRNPRDGLRYVWIDPGKFTMGCAAGHETCKSDEFPLHSVQLTKGFWISETPITVQASNVFREGRYSANSHAHDADSSYATHAIVNVAWTEANDYCRWAGGRLPSECMWEYCARAGDFTRSRPNSFSYAVRDGLHICGEVRQDLVLPGHSVTVDATARIVGNITAQTIVILGSVNGSITATDTLDIRNGARVISPLKVAHIKIEDGAYFKGTIDIMKNPRTGVGQSSARKSASVSPYPVKIFSANAFGLFDIPGPFREWCSDWFDGLYYRVSPERDPEGPQGGLTRVVRGGPTPDEKGVLQTRYSARSSADPNRADAHTTFRCVLEGNPDRLSGT